MKYIELLYPSLPGSTIIIILLLKILRGRDSELGYE